MKNRSNLTFLCSGGSIIPSYYRTTIGTKINVFVCRLTLCTCIICVSKDSLASLLKCVLISRCPVFKNGCILRGAGTVMDWYRAVKAKLLQPSSWELEIPSSLKNSVKMQRVVRKQREVVMIHFWVFLLLPLIVARSIMAGSVVSRQVGWYLSCLAQWFQIAETRQK